MKNRDEKSHGNTGNKNAAKPSDQHLTSMPSVRVTAVPERGILAKAASKKGQKLTEWCRDAFREKLEREAPELYEKARDIFGKGE